ncbi:hypothetical protein [Novosphingobium sp. ST904]|uniref:hypothetical protein n=1 Tax=Novosphingobium sp. ST904 TaxID=1684385 RepID=UPI0006C8C8A1|nr:hypothetical protein [Novosphingobium sp. ST904]KPH67538.1 hypothetical protein ADT71_02230 [Novosphingobium sp. ST904]TCM30042.1 hypothetical protein EDF59_12769 [Novosphingobium sp. ST904]
MRSRTQDRTDSAALHAITMAASSRFECPSNDRLAAAIGARGSSAGAAALARLERSGAITVERGHGWRVVTVNEFGIRTEGPDA